MELTQLAQIGEFVGGIAVLVTLVYLAVQMRQANTTNKQEGFRLVQGRLMDWVEQVTATKEMAHLYNLGCAEYEALDEDDRFRFNWIQARRWAVFELLLDYHAGGSAKDELRGNIELHLRNDLLKPGVRQWWEHWAKETFATDFRDHVQRIREGGGV